MRRILFIACLLLIASIGNAQMIRIGAKAGMNFSSFGGDKALENATGYHLGLSSQFNLPLVGLGVQPEVQFVSTKSNGGSINYFEIPVNLRYQILPLQIVRPIVLIGPYWGYAVGFGGNLNKNVISRTNWGFGFGAGIEIKKFQLVGRYALGLSNISKISNETLRNNAFTISLVYFFK